MPYGLALTMTDASANTIYCLIAVVFAGIAGAKWLARKIDQAIKAAAPYFREFIDTHTDAVTALKDNLIETSNSNKAIHEKLTSVHKTLDIHGETLTKIDARTKHLEQPRVNASAE